LLVAGKNRFDLLVDRVQAFLAAASETATVW
jgi:hypothetical protein